ncbi:MAG: polyprenol monophosphomannose synthase [Anaerolineae bacterium]|nr:polyprenol monophosphomannose synthase [Anaerolineae bacterium]
MSNSKTAPSIAVVVPTYNERENIESLVIQVLALPIDASVIIVDDDSPDGTGVIADRLAEEHPGRLEVVHRSGKLGLGTAHVAGFEQALSKDVELICTMDADFSHNPAYIPEIVERICQGYDLVIGSRYVEGGGTAGCTTSRKLLSWVANFFARATLGLSVHDATAGFRCYRREVLEEVDIGTIRADGYSFLIEMLYRVQRMGWQVGETPILFENRRQGVSKISRDEILKAVWTVVRLAGTRLVSRDTKPEDEADRLA